MFTHFTAPYLTILSSDVSQLWFRFCPSLSWSLSFSLSPHTLFVPISRGRLVMDAPHFRNVQFSPKVSFLKNVGGQLTSPDGLSHP